MQEILRPEPGERILEIGPGTGYYSLSIAQNLDPGSTLVVLDVQRDMLDHTNDRAQTRETQNIASYQGAAQALPFGSDSFDAVYLVAVLGEIPDQERALAELHRILTPTGRLVVGELVADPHFVRLGSLHHRLTRRGFEFVERTGSRFGYYALYRPVRDRQ